MIVWLIISAAIRLCLVAFITMSYATMIIRIKGGFTDENPPFYYSKALMFAVTALYLFHSVLPT